MQSTNTIIIGGSAAGLAASACLKDQAIDHIILEKHSTIGQAWRNHYDRLHLHTSKKFSALPFKKFDARLPKYVSKNELIQYLESYTTDLDIQPVFNSPVRSIKQENGFWICESDTGRYQSKNIIIATGINQQPRQATWQGLENFRGTIIHSSAFKNGKPFNNQDVLVVGFGNSACEQALCLHEHGARPALSVRSPVNVLPREILGIPVLELGILTSWIKPKVSDKLTAPIIRIIIGDIRKLGLKKSKYGPKEQIEKQKRIPLLDIGTVKLIKENKIRVFGDIERIDGNRIFFEDGKDAVFDAIILATGYVSPKDYGCGLSGGPNQSGLYFCGFHISSNGMLREIGIEAAAIAKSIKASLE